MAVGVLVYLCAHAETNVHCSIVGRIGGLEGLGADSRPSCYQTRDLLARADLLRRGSVASFPRPLQPFRTGACSGVVALVVVTRLRVLLWMCADRPDEDANAVRSSTESGPEMPNSA